MIFGRKKKKPEPEDVQALFARHVELVRLSLAQLQKVVDGYLEGHTSLRDDSFHLHELEHEADTIRRRIQEAMSAGAFLPFYREDYITLAGMIDKIAGRAVELSKSLVLEKPIVPADCAADYRLLAQSVLETYMPLVMVMDALFTDAESVARYTEQVSEGEQVSDSIEWKLSRRVFASDLPRIEKVITGRAVLRIAAISDAIENAADKARVIVAKQMH